MRRRLVAQGDGVAAVLARRGPISGEAFRFMRDSLELSAAELGELLDVGTGTISRWENAKRQVDRSVWVTLGSLVLDRIEGRRTTMERLAAIGERRRSKTIRIEADAR